MTIPTEDRLPVIADGLRLLVEHITELQASAQVLRGAGRDRSANIIDGVLAEECAKVLILLERNDARPHSPTTPASHRAQQNDPAAHPADLAHSYFLPLL
ncbi:hypothetical protein [Plantibacter sp. YIM 135249]|uniref:hypothetical protein n=1 Tax=Plantibacter sp. YIM 135249 TaxID=3423918 RepID=UPI003D34FC8F